jgi:hypothetical protein
MDSNLREMREEMKAGQEFLKEEMLTKLDAHHERMMAGIDSQLEEMEACLGKTEATDLMANPEETESWAEYEEVPKEEAAAENFGTLKNEVV